MTIELAKKYNIPAIRVPSERPHIYMLKTVKTMTRLLELLVVNALSRFNTPLWRPDQFSGFAFAGNLNRKNLQTVLRHLPRAGTCELMCHPGINDETGTYGHWRYNWSDELNALIHQETREMLRQKSIRLTSYRELIR
jgi:hypothetical protein